MSSTISWDILYFMLSYIYTKVRILIFWKEWRNDDLVILTKNEYNELIQKIRDLEYWNKIDKRIENIKAGNAHFHELIEVDDE